MTATIDTLPELLAYARALESEAVERYEELAEQMAVHHNHELAELFRKMAAIEQQHVDQVDTLAAATPLPRLAPWDYQWNNPEAPETIAFDQSHYRLTPYQALTLMLAGEERAGAFFAGVARQTGSEAVRDLAVRLAAEEQQHAEQLRQWLTRYPEPAPDWDVDLDEPVPQA